jgi:hypothetical protein
LPSQPDQDFGYNVTSYQLGELFYNELGGTARHQNPAIVCFLASMVRIGLVLRWLLLPSMVVLSKGSFVDTLSGMQSNAPNLIYNYVWSVSLGQVNAIPVPGAIWLFGSAVVGLIGYGRSKIA